MHPSLEPSTTAHSAHGLWWRSRWRGWRARCTTLPEPEAQGRAATVGYVAAAGAPLLAWPSLAGGDAIDDTAVYFLLEMALKTPEEVERMRRVERRRLAKEKEEKEQEEKREKERQKAEVEETIARLRGNVKRGRKRCFLVAAPLAAAFVVDYGSGTFLAGFVVLVLPTQCYLRSSAGLTFQASWLVWTVHLAFCSLLFCIMAGMDQKDSSLRASAWIASSSSACCCSCKPRTLRPVYVHAQAHFLHAVRPPRFFLDDCDELFPVWLFLAESEIQRTLPLNI